MAEMIAGGTVLICMILVLRRLTFGKISMGMRYALWLMVALRMILPVSFGSSPLSIMNPVQGARTYLAGRADAVWTGRSVADAADGTGRSAQKADAGGLVEAAGQGTADGSGYGARTVDVGGSVDVAGQKTGDGTGRGAQTADVGGLVEAAGQRTVNGSGYGAQITDAGGLVDMESQKTAGREAQGVWRILPKLRRVAAALWILGMIAVGGSMLIRQARFFTYLHQIREKAPLQQLPDLWIHRLAEHGMRVWLADGLPSPCMAGRDIYISPEQYADADKRLHILAHEYAHALLGDTLWALLRSMLCAVYWFHPLVWLAAYEAKQDSELACDERAVRLLGETQRFAYGRTLIGLATGEKRGDGVTGLILTMDGSGRRMRQRVAMIADRKKSGTVAVGTVLAAAILLCGCAFTGAKTVQDSEPKTDDEVLTADGENDAQAAKAAEVELAEQARIQERWVEMEEEQKRRAAEEAARAAKVAEAEQADRAQMQKRLNEIEEEQRQIRFANMLYALDDTGLASAAQIDRTAYYDYLYNGAACPMEDGAWYLLCRDEQYGIDFYGLYTQEYGCRGVKTLIDGDVNTFDLPWTSAAVEGGVQILTVEQTRDGLPRTFTFKMCMENTGRSEVWKLCLADRYDTGTIELYAFDEQDYQQQFRDQVSFLIDRENDIVLMLCGKDVKGGIDISAYAEYTVEDVIWDGSAVSYDAQKNAADQLTFRTCIGLRLAETDEIQYQGLSIIDCPVQTGAWGGREFTLGAPEVDLQYVNGMIR